jgi:hypothetical protein
MALAGFGGPLADWRFTCGVVVGLFGGFGVALADASAALG